MSHHHRRWRALPIMLGLAFLALALAVIVQSASAAPAAGTVVKNQASASYRACLDDVCAQQSGLLRVTSNLVETLIQAVPGMELLDDQQKPARAGSLVYFPHTLTNTGNNTDHYQLCIDNVGSDIVHWTVYTDANNDGQPDVGSVLFDDSDADGCADAPSADLAPGESEHLVIETEVAANAATGNVTLRLTATSAANNAISRANTDTLKVLKGPVLEVVKSINAEQTRSPGGPLTVTLTYRNSSDQVATGVILDDVLPTASVDGIAAGMTYVAGSARWSVTGNTALTDAEDGSQGSGTNTITFCAYDGTAANTDCQDRVRAVLGRLGPGAQGTLTFQVQVRAGLAGGDRLRNSADFFYRNAAGDTQFGVPAPFTSNTVTLTVIDQALAPAVVANVSQSDATTGADDSSDTGNLTTVASADQGAGITFTNVIWNTGDGLDSFDLNVDRGNDRGGNALASPFPDSTAFQLAHADGNSPLTDTNGDGVMDTGPIPLPDQNGQCPARFVSDGSHCGLVLVVRASLAADAQGGPFQVTLRATSNTDTVVSNAVSDRLTAIATAGVDLTGERPADGSAPGEGAGPGTAPLSTLTLAPGARGVLPVYVNNTGGRGDTFDLAYSDSNFSAGTLPDGWQVAFLADGGSGDCSSVGAVLSNTGVIAAGANRLLCVRVTAPAKGAGNAALALYLRAQSPTTGATDLIHQAATVNAGPALGLTPDQVGQVAPGASTIYSHNLTNTGNVPLTAVKLSADASANPGWSVVLFEDTNGNGQWDADDAHIQSGQALGAGGDGVLAAGETVVVFAKVFAPANAGLGTTVTQTLTVTGDNAASSVTATATDTTTVSNTDVSITKEQALDADCDGVPDGPGTCSGDACFVYTRFQAKPGQQCVIYRLVAANTGAAALYQVTINDKTQPFTTYLAAALRCDTPGGDCRGAVSAPADQGSGDVSVNVGALGAGETATLIFGLRVQ